MAQIHVNTFFIMLIIGIIGFNEYRLDKFKDLQETKHNDLKECFQDIRKETIRIDRKNNEQIASVLTKNYVLPNQDIKVVTLKNTFGDYYGDWFGETGTYFMNSEVRYYKLKSNEIIEKDYVFVGGKLRKLRFTDVEKTDDCITYIYKIEE